ncbi:uncharacterized protein OCT59_024587 [Rhizophagus irregularis]|uniref:uncharacterized protein n=1 Tax=Rhizophagus irregularis TaxID=588596 RepID=UPI00332ABFA9|nr:hypothetical protein OCT59_024587 [Rhizophagus irregularis]
MYQLYAEKICPTVHTLRDIENRGVVEGPLSKHTSSGNRLGSIRESELEKALRGNIKTASDIANDYKDLQDIYLERREQQLWPRKLRPPDKVQILSLEVKIRELEGKLEDIDLERTYYDLDVMGGVIEKPVEMPKLPDWLHDNLRSIVCKFGLKDKVMELDKKLAKEDILEVLQKVILEKDHHLQDANARLEKALSEKDSLLHEANTHIKKHLASFEKKTSPDSFETLQVIKVTDISNTTLALPHLHSITGPEAEIRVMLSQSDIQKNQKTGLPPMKLRLLDMDEVTKHESSRNIGHPAMTWPFSMLVMG